jgi:hypothetical protein
VVYVNPVLEHELEAICYNMIINAEHGIGVNMFYNEPNIVCIT